MYQRIIVAVDGSETSWCALRHAVNLAAEQRARLRIVHAIEWIEHLAVSLAGDRPVDMTAIRKSMHRVGDRVLAGAEAYASALQVEAEAALVEGEEPEDRTARLLEREATRWNADLIVLGTHGRSGLDRFVLGSVAESMIRMTRQPVLLIRTS